MLLSLTDTRNLLAEFYREGCLDVSVDMVELTGLLEYLSGVFQQEDVFHSWNRIRLDSKRYNKTPYDRYLARLKRSYYNLVCNKIKEELTLSGKQNTDLFAAWKDYFYKALSCWCYPVYSEMIKWDHGFELQFAEEFYILKKNVRLIYEDRWADTYLFFRTLADETKDNQVKSSFRLAEAQIQLYYMQDFAQADTTIDKAKKVYPSNKKIPRIEGEYYIKMTAFGQARNLISEAISLDPIDPMNYIFMGLSYKEEEKFDAARQWIRDGEAVNFMETELYLKYIDLLTASKKASGQKEQIDNWIEKVKILEGDFPENNVLYTIYRYAGSAFQAIEDYRLAEEYFDTAIALDPSLPAAYLDKAYMFMSAEKYIEAEKYFRLVSSVDDENFDPFWGLGGLYEKQERWQEAIEMYSKGFRLRPEWNGWTNNSLGVIYYRIKDYTQAKYFFTEAISCYPGDPVYYDNLTDSLEKLNQKNEIEDVLLKKFLNNDKNADYAIDLAEYYQENGQLTLAKKYFELAIDIDKGNVQYVESLGVIEEALQNYDQAEKLFLQNLESSPGYLTANRAGIFYYNRENYEKAISLYQKAINFNPDDGVIFENIALAYSKMGNINEAIENYKRAIQLRPEVASLHYALGVLYESSDPDKALEYLVKATEFDNLGSYHNYVGAFLYNHQNYEDALPWFEIAAGREPETDLYKLWWSACLNKLNRLQESKNVLEDLVKRKPEIADYKLRLGYVLFRLLLYSQAYELFQQVESECRNDPTFLEWYSAAALFSGNEQKADEIELRLLAENNSNEQFFYDAALMYYESKIPAGLNRAVNRLKKAIEFNSANSTYYRMLGNVYKFLHKNEDAEAAFRESIRVRPEDDIALNDYGVFLYETGKYPESIIFYKQAIELKQDPLYSKNLDLAYSVLKDQKNLI